MSHVLTVPNHHIEGCGEPPNLLAEGCYSAYYENTDGEQMVFQFDYQSKKGTLWCGDWSWEKLVPVLGGKVLMNLGISELTWLELVWETATRAEPEIFLLGSYKDYLDARIPQLEEISTIYGEYKEEGALPKCLVAQQLRYYKRKKRETERKIATLLLKEG
jgi:hypothetical protein